MNETPKNPPENEEKKREEIRKGLFRSGPQGMPTAARTKEIKSNPETKEEASKREVYALLSILSEDMLSRMAEYLQTPEGLLREKEKFVKKHSALKVSETGALEFAGTLDGGEYTSEDIVRDFAGVQNVFSRIAKRELKKGEEAFSSELAKMAYGRIQRMRRPEDWSLPLLHRASAEEMMKAGIGTIGTQTWSLLLALPKIYQKHFHKIPTEKEFGEVAKSAERILVELSSMHVFHSMYFADVSTKQGLQISAGIEEALLPNVFSWLERVKIHEENGRAHLDWNQDFLENALGRFDGEDEFLKDFLKREPRQGCPARDVRVSVDNKRKSGVLLALHILTPLAEEVVLPNQEIYWRSVKDMVEKAKGQS